jgi:hypothetical protein
MFDNDKGPYPLGLDLVSYKSFVLDPGTMFDNQTGPYPLGVWRARVAQ